MLEIIWEELKEMEVSKKELKESTRAFVLECDLQENKFHQHQLYCLDLLWTWGCRNCVIPSYSEAFKNVDTLQLVT